MSHSHWFHTRELAFIYRIRFTNRASSTCRSHWSVNYLAANWMWIWAQFVVVVPKAWDNFFVSTTPIMSSKRRFPEGMTGAVPRRAQLLRMPECIFKCLNCFKKTGSFPLSSDAALQPPFPSLELRGAGERGMEEGFSMAKFLLWGAGNRRFAKTCKWVKYIFAFCLCLQLSEFFAQDEWLYCSEYPHCVKVTVYTT